MISVRIILVVRIKFRIRLKVLLTRLTLGVYVRLYVEVCLKPTL